MARVPSPLDAALGLVYDEVAPDRVRAHLTIDPARHHQPWGGVHGGLHCAIVESLASTGAAVDAEASGMHPVGLENATSFVRLTRTGRLEAEATPLHRGRRVHLWEVRIADGDGRLVARGTCRMLLVPADE
jgi:1,4-dihydroxy-2-naphthoyl-CoA hydrolase